MNKKILIGSIIAVVLLTLVSFSSVVGYSSVKSNPSNTIITDEPDSYTPIILVLQLIAKLRNYKEIQNVESEDELLQIIEGDEELNSIFGQLSVEDCGCEEETSIVDFEDNPIICSILAVIFGIMVIRINLLLAPLILILLENGNVILGNLLRLRTLPIQVIGFISGMSFFFVFNCYDFYPF